MSLGDNRRNNRRNKRNSPVRGPGRDDDQPLGWVRLALSSNAHALRLMGILAVVYAGTTVLATSLGINGQLVVDAITVLITRAR